MSAACNQLTAVRKTTFGRHCVGVLVLVFALVWALHAAVCGWSQFSWIWSPVAVAAAIRLLAPRFNGSDLQSVNVFVWLWVLCVLWARAACLVCSCCPPGSLEAAARQLGTITTANAWRVFLIKIAIKIAILLIFVPLSGWFLFSVGRAAVVLGCSHCCASCGACHCTVRFAVSCIGGTQSRS